LLLERFGALRIPVQGTTYLPDYCVLFLTEADRG
jgi:hypothetical protein